MAPGIVRVRWGPTILFTLGVLLLAWPLAPYQLLVIPVFWLVVDAWSAWVLGMTQDFVPAAVGLVTLVGILRQSPRPADR
jgi:hypothetical protein